MKDPHFECPVDEIGEGTRHERVSLHKRRIEHDADALTHQKTIVMQILL